MDSHNDDNATALQQLLHRRSLMTTNRTLTHPAYDAALHYFQHSHQPQQTPPTKQTIIQGITSINARLDNTRWNNRHDWMQFGIQAFTQTASDILGDHFAPNIHQNLQQLVTQFITQRHWLHPNHDFTLLLELRQQHHILPAHPSTTSLNTQPVPQPVTQSVTQPEIDDWDTLLMDDHTVHPWFLEESNNDLSHDLPWPIIGLSHDSPMFLPSFSQDLP